MIDPPRNLSSEGKQAFENAARNSSPRLSNRRIVREMLPAIQHKLEAGWSHEEIRQELAQAFGFNGTLSTLYSYVSKLSVAAKSGVLDEASTKETSIVTPDAVEAPPARRRVSETLVGPILAEILSNPAPSKKKTSLVERLNKPI